MSTAGESFSLRPLSIGEIFDRGVSLYVQRFVPLALIALAAVLPLTGLQYIMADSNKVTYQEIASIIAQAQQHPSRPPDVPLLKGATPPAWAWLLIVVVTVLLPFTATAIAVALARIYEGVQPDWRACYAQVFRRWGPLLGTLFLGAVIFIAAAFSGWLAIFILTFVAIFAVRGVAALGIVVLLLGLMVMAIWVVFMFMTELAITFALFSVVLEGCGFAQAIGRAFERLFNRTEILKAAGVTVSLGLIYLGLVVISGGLTLVGYFVIHSNLLAAVAGGLTTFIHVSLLTLLAAVYYFDVRVRREGLDLQAALERFEGNPAT